MSLLLHPSELFTIREIVTVALMGIRLSLKGDVPVGMMPTKAPQFPKEEKRVEDIEANVPQFPLARSGCSHVCRSRK